jgi:fatty acid desaturase
MKDKQTYEPYRSSLLARTDLFRLYRLSPRRVIVDTLAAWGAILAAMAAVAVKPTWWMVALAVPVIGTRLYSLLIIAHDGLHRRLFGTVRANDLWNDLFILGSIGTITRLNRINHMRRHAELALPTDPDRFKYARAGRETPLRFLATLTCVPLLVKTVGNVLLPKQRTNENGAYSTSAIPQKGYCLRDVAIIGSWQIALIGGLSWAIGWWAYPILWVIPVVFAVCCDILRVFCEHSRLTDDDEADTTMRLVSYEANLLEKILFAPNNMNHHIAHHLWPSICGPAFRTTTCPKRSN